METRTTLRLSADEAQLLSMLLASDRDRLSEEINHTDRRQFRELLRHREALLDGVLARLNARGAAE